MYIRANFYTVKSGGFERAALESLSPLRSVRLFNAINCNSKVYTMSLHKLFTMLLLTAIRDLQTSYCSCSRRCISQGDGTDQQGCKDRGIRNPHPYNISYRAERSADEYRSWSRCHRSKPEALSKGAG